MSPPYEIFAQLDEVVDLPVHDDADGPVLVEERLLGLGAQIDDREAPVAERSAPAAPDAVGVGTPVGDRVVHPAHARLVRRRVARDETRDTAHDAAFTTAGATVTLETRDAAWYVPGRVQPRARTRAGHARRGARRDV